MAQNFIQRILEFLLGGQVESVYFLSKLESTMADLHHYIAFYNNKFGEVCKSYEEAACQLQIIKQEVEGLDIENSVEDAEYFQCLIERTQEILNGIIIPNIPTSYPVRSLQVSERSSSSISLEWLHNETGFSRYVVEYGLTEEGEYIEAGRTNLKEFVITGLEADTLYYLRIKVIEELDAASEYSTIFSRTLLYTPISFVVTPQSGTEAVCTWADINETETGHEIGYSDNLLTWTVYPEIGPDIITYLATGLPEGDLITFRIRALQDLVNNPSDYSFKIVQMPLETPTDLTIVSTTDSTVDLTWVDNSSVEDEYIVEISTDNITWAEEVVLGANVTSYTVVGLQQMTEYFFRVIASNTETVSSPSNIETYITPLFAPTNLTPLVLTSTDIVLQWQINSLGVENSFSIERSLDNITFVQIASVATGVNTYIDNTLSESVEYFYKVKAVGSLSDSEYSDTTNATTFYPFGLGLNFLGDAGGIVDYVQIPSLFGEPMPVEHTVSFWMTYKNPERPNANEYFMISAGGGGMYWVLNTVGLVGEGTVKLFGNATGGNQVGVSSAPYALLDGQPHFICFRRTDFDALNYNIDFIIDGVKSSGQILKSECLTAFKTTHLSNSNTGLQNVTLDEFRFFPSLLSDEDISKYVDNKEYALFDALPTIFDHDFNTVGATAGGANGAYTTITDKSGNGHDGTMTGFDLMGTDSNYVDSVEKEIDILTATATSPTAIQLDWDYSIVGLPQIASTIEHDTDPNFGSPVSIAIPEGLSSTLITGLTIGTKYYFRIQGATMTGWFKTEASYGLTDPLSLFGSDLHAWYSGDSYQGLSTDITQVDDQSGNGRHLIEGANGQWDILIDSDGNPNLNIAAVGARLHNNTNWNGLGTGDFFVIQRMSSTIGTTFRVLWGADVGSTGNADAQNFNVSGGSVKTIGWRNTNTDYWYKEQGNPNGSVQMFTAKVGTNRLWNNGLEVVMTDASIVAKSNSFDNLSVGQLSDGLTDPTLISFNDLIFIKGSPEDYPDLVNVLHEEYLAPRYPSLGIVSPNL